MCGIVGFKVVKDRVRYETELSRAKELLHHRGPDSQDIWMKDGVGLAHTRLSILDLSPSGGQPMVSNDGRYVICFNGQVYNYIEIAAQLTTKFKVCSDTRVILEAIAELGLEKALPLFNGMFVFALWDMQERKLHLVRDSIGIKPLYWALTPEGYIFASEIKSLRAFLSFCLDVNSQALQQYFSKLYIPAPLSIYNNCNKLLPGHILTISRSGHTITKFIPKVNSYQKIKSLTEAETILTQLLDTSVTQHSRSDVPFSAFLSGGIDSSLIVSILAQKFPIDTYSIGYHEVDFDESARAKRIAEYLGVKHQTIILTPDDVRASIENIADIYDEPFADASCLPTYLLAQTVARNTKIAFSGDGADELFAGYPRYFNVLKQWKRMAFIPYGMRKILAEKIIPDDSAMFNFFAKAALHDPQQSIKYIKKTLPHKNIWEMFCADNYLGLPLAAFSDDFKNNMVVDAEHELERVQNSLRWLLRQDQESRLPDAMLTKVDRASMRSSLEVRVPFLDNEIVAFSRALPTNMLGQHNSQKIILKSMLSKHMPTELFTMPKTGFHIPMKIWLKTHYKEWAEDALFCPRMQEQNIFNMSELRKLWQAYCNGNANLFHPLWSAIIYSQWQEKFRI